MAKEVTPAEIDFARKVLRMVDKLTRDVAGKPCEHEIDGIRLRLTPSNVAAVREALTGLGG